MLAIATLFNSPEEIVIYAPVTLPTGLLLPFYLARNTENVQIYLVKNEQGKFTAYPCGRDYHFSSGQIWARPIENFLEILGEEPTYYYRIFKVSDY